MANFELSGVEEMEKELFALAENAEEIAIEAVNEAVPIMEKSMKKNIKSAAIKGYATGELANAVKSFGGKINQYGCFAEVIVDGKDSRGTRNGEKLAYLHYGTSTQQGTGCVTKAVNEAEQGCIEKMQQVINRRIEGK